MEALLFHAAGGAFLAPLADLDEVLMPVRLRPLAHAPAFITGVFNLRGLTLPVLDLAERLGRGPAAPRVWQRGNRILRFSTAGPALGVIVDGVTGIRTLAGAERRPPVLATAAAPAFLGDLWLLDGQLTQAITLARLLDPAELAQLRGATAEAA